MAWEVALENHDVKVLVVAQNDRSAEGRPVESNDRWSQTYGVLYPNTPRRIRRSIKKCQKWCDKRNKREATFNQVFDQIVKENTPK